MSMSDTDKESVRRATKADYEDIISIIPSGEYVGDFLPDSFHDLIDGPCYDAFVYCVNGKIIGFGAVTLVDGGMTGVMRNGRIKKEFRGRGILRKLHVGMLKYFPDIRYSISTTSVNLVDVYRQIDKGQYTLICVRNCIFYHGRKENVTFSKLGDRGLTANTKILRETDIRKLIQNKLLYPKVFENDRLLVRYTPFRLMQENVPVILSGKTRVVVSFMNNNEQTLLTFGTYHIEPDGTMFSVIDLYGTIGRTLIVHILLHIQSFFAIAEKREFTLEIYYGEFSNEIENVMTEIGMKNASIGTTRRNEMLCIEQELKPLSKL